MPLPSLQKEPLHGYLGFKILDIKAFNDGLEWRSGYSVEGLLAGCVVKLAVSGEVFRTRRYGSESESP